MATRTVLVSYLESNKVLKIPSGTADDIEYLKEVFFREFSVKPDLRSCIIFQKYNSDWSVYIDFESDAHLQDKDRLKAVVTSDPTTDSTGDQANLESLVVLPKVYTIQ